MKVRRLALAATSNDAFQVIPKISGSVAANHVAAFADGVHIRDGGAVESIIAIGTLAITASNSVGCVDQTAAAPGARSTMKVVVSPIEPQSNTVWSGNVSASDTVDIHVCMIVALTASPVTYNWSALP